MKILDNLFPMLNFYFDAHLQKNSAPTHTFMTMINHMLRIMYNYLVYMLHMLVNCNLWYEDASNMCVKCLIGCKIKMPILDNKWLIPQGLSQKNNYMETLNIWICPNHVEPTFKTRLSWSKEKAFNRGKMTRFTKVQFVHIGNCI